jgi:hypothetical protein
MESLRLEIFDWINASLITTTISIKGPKQGTRTHSIVLMEYSNCDTTRQRKTRKSSPAYSLTNSATIFDDPAHHDKHEYDTPHMNHKPFSANLCVFALSFFAPSLDDDDSFVRVFSGIVYWSVAGQRLFPGGGEEGE